MQDMHSLFRRFKPQLIVMKKVSYKDCTTAEIVRSLGASYKEYRLRKRLTQGDVAQQTGLTIATISKFESGMATNISFATFLLLLKAVGRIDDMAGVLPPLTDQTEEGVRKVHRIRNKA